jgi:hypothetical protein
LPASVTRHHIHINQAGRDIEDRRRGLRLLVLLSCRRGLRGRERRKCKK